MANKILVKETVISRRTGEDIVVTFPMDKELYLAIVKNTAEQARKEHMTYEYYAYVEEKNYLHKITSLDETNEDGTPSIVLVDKNPSPLESILLNERNNRIHEALEKLKPEHKAIIIGIFFEDKKQVDIARELNVDKRVISKRFKKALEQLKNLLEEK